MFALVLRLKRRIKKLLKVQTESRQLHTPSTHSNILKITIPVLAAILIAILYPGQSLVDPLDMPRRGEIALENVIAPFQITIIKSDREIKDEENAIRNSMPFVVDEDTVVTAALYSSLSTFTRLADSVRNSRWIEPGGNADSAAAILQSRFPMLSSGAIMWALDSTVQLDTVRMRLQRIYESDIYEIGVLNDLAALPRGPTGQVLVRRGSNEHMISRGRMLDMVRAYARLLTALRHLADSVALDDNNYYLVGKNFLQPNLRIDMREYSVRLTGAFSEIERVKKVVQKGDAIVRQGQPVSQDQEEMLRELASLQRAQEAGSGYWRDLLSITLRIVIVGSLFGALYLFLSYFRREVFHSNPKLFALILVFGLQLVFVRLAGVMAEVLQLDSLYLYPVALLPIMITILFDTQLGILTTVILALLLGVMHRFSFSVVLLTMVVGSVGCFSSRTVRKRTDFYRIWFAVTIAYLSVILIVENLKLTGSQDINVEMGFGVIVAALSVVVTVFVLPIIEALFGFTTDFTLLELSDLNHPLLKRLSIEAPGTYHHSMVVSNLCEAGAEAIGANALLARVGAYYHDIGKIEIPEYFVENQLGLKSKHEDLTPSMSSLILTSHVKQGRVLGEEAEIPDAVLNFIEEHHGTMIMSYFHNKAIEQGADPETAEKFRYPGPKPQTRETAIAMVADAVEAASRTLDEPSPARIDSLIQKIISDRFQSGELDECPLTLRDLAGIRTAFAQVLNAAFHHRVTYPKKAQPV